MNGLQETATAQAAAANPTAAPVAAQPRTATTGSPTDFVTARVTSDCPQTGPARNCFPLQISNQNDKASRIHVCSASMSYENILQSFRCTCDILGNVYNLVWSLLSIAKILFLRPMFNNNKT